MGQPTWTYREWMGPLLDEGAAWLSDRPPIREVLARWPHLTRHKALALRYYIDRHGAVRGGDRPGSAETSEALEIVCGDRYTYDPDADVYVTFLRSIKRALPVPGATHRDMKRAYSDWDGAPQTINEIARRFHVSRRAFIEYKGVHGWTHDSDPFTAEEIADRDIEDLVGEVIESKRDALYQQAKAAEWKQIKKRARKWSELDAGILDAIRTHIEHEGYSYSIPRVQLRPSPHPYAVVVSPTDLHWGMYAWGAQTGDAYDREECRRRLQAATADLIARLPGTPERVYYATCSDSLHVDGVTATTTRGTPQDIDGTPEEIMITGFEAIRDDIAAWAQIAPVSVIGMLGNHDRASGLACLLYLEAWFAGQDDRVTVVRDFRARIYQRFGSTGIQFHHGDRTKPDKLGPCFAVEERELWGATRYHVAFTGHLHHERAREVNGVRVYQMSSLAGTDRWHAGAGYVDAEAALSAYLIDRDRGIVGQIVSPV